MWLECLLKKFRDNLRRLVGENGRIFRQVQLRDPFFGNGAGVHRIRQRQHWCSCRRIARGMLLRSWEYLCFRLRFAL